MKKKVALVFIAFMILMQSCVLAQNEQTFEVDALDVFSKVDGEGYHDEAGMSFDAPQFSNLGCVILHGGDWVKYDLSSFPAGTYSLTAKIANKYATNLDVKVDDVALVKSKALESTGDYSSFEEITLENFYLSENTSYLTFNNVGSMGLYLDCFELTLLSDDNVLPIKIGATDVIPGGQGTGYSDSSGSGTLEVSGQTVCIRTGEWLAYSLPMDSEAVYKLYIKAATKYGANYDVYVNDKKQITNKLLESTGDYTTHKEHEVGYVTLDEGENIIKIYSTSANASYFEAILFERVVDLECEAVVGNRMTDSGLVARGSSSLLLTFSNELSMSEVTKDNISIIDTSGKELKCFAGVDENKKILKVILNDSLGFGEEYTVTLSDFADGAGQILSNQQMSFVTGNKDDDEGLASLKDVMVTYENGHLKACGQVISDSDVGINGRKVTLSAKAPGTDEEITWKETLSFFDEETSKDGMFSMEYLFTDEADSGKYTVYLDAEYNKEKDETDIYYYNADFNNEILSEMSNVKDRETMLSKLMTYGMYLDIDVEAFQSQIGDFGYVLDGMLNKEYKKADEIVNSFYGSFYLEKINQAESISDISNLLEDEEIREIFGIDEAKWGLAESRIEDVTSVLYEAERYATIEDLKEEIIRIIDGILLDEYSVEIPEISVESKKVNIGQIASLNIELLKPIENVSQIGITLKYTSDEKELYENTPVEIIDDDFEVERKSGDFVHSYVITKKDGELFALEDKIITLKFTAGSELLGEYPCVIDGYVEFCLPEMSEDVNIKGNFKNAVNTYIEVEKTEKKEYSGGGSVGKGYGSSSGGKGDEPVIIPPENEPSKEEIKIGFNDLESVKWAEESILYLADKGIVNGKTQELFMPNDLCTRAEICKMLSLALELSEEGGEFTDVKESDWYYSYVKKMANAKIIQGYSDGTFAPNSFITREDLAVVAKRVLESKKVQMPQAFDKFNDDILISDYAKESVGLMKEMGILNGMGENMFSPKTNVSRAMAAKVIYSIMTY